MHVCMSLSNLTILHPHIGLHHRALQDTHVRLFLTGYKCVLIKLDSSMIVMLKGLSKSFGMPTSRSLTDSLKNMTKKERVKLEKR